LTESLFDHEPGPVAVRLWGGVVGTSTPPARSVRRLILRPSAMKWWGDEAYTEMEATLGEEPGRNG
jgi:hypothetical protein